jgi:Cu2+-containing amine oxidase
MAELLNRREEALALRLAQSQPESAGELTALLDRIRERVVEMVLADDRFRERLLDRRHRVLTADYREDKAADGERVSRLCEIGIYDYDSDVLMIAVVDLRAGSVIDVFDRAGVAPPITAEELAEAREIAAQAPSIRAALTDERSQVVAFPAPTYAFERRSASTQHRTCLLYAGHPDGETASAVVDLSARKVISEDELPEILRSGRPSARGHASLDEGEV